MIIHPYTSQKVTSKPTDSEKPKSGIFDVTSSTLEMYVLQASHHYPVLLDFWAPWCGPCKQFVPLLESLQVKYPKPWILAKVNIDTNPQIANQFQVKSIPTVVLFVKGQPVDAFMGIVPEAHLVRLLDHVYTAYGSSIDKNNPLEEAKILFEQNNYSQCADLLMHVLDQNQELEQPDIERLIMSCAFINNLEEAKKLLPTLLDPSCMNRFLNIEGVGTRSINNIIDTQLSDMNSNNKENLIFLFQMLGSNHILTIEGRKRMSAILFS